MSPEFLSLNPNNKIPAILDPDGPGGKPLALFESGAILLYLAEKTGRSCRHDAAARYETIQWLMFQMGGIGPMFGQVGFFHKFAGKDYEDKRPRDRYVAESKRLLGVLEGQLERPRLDHGRRLHDRRHRAPSPGCATWSASTRRATSSASPTSRRSAALLDAFLARPAVVRGLTIPAKPA